MYVCCRSLLWLLLLCAAVSWLLLASRIAVTMASSEFLLRMWYLVNLSLLSDVRISHSEVVWVFGSQFRVVIRQWKKVVVRQIIVVIKWIAFHNWNYLQTLEPVCILKRQIRINKTIGLYNEHLLLFDAAQAKIANIMQHEVFIALVRHDGSWHEAASKKSRVGQWKNEKNLDSDLKLNENTKPPVELGRAEQTLDARKWRFWFWLFTF